MGPVPTPLGRPSPAETMWQEWLDQYGYWIVFFGAIIEGETVLILAGFSLSRGYLDPATTYMLAVAGGAIGDFLYFLLGRRYGPAVFRRFRRLRPLRARAVLVARQWGRYAAFFTRFLYGLRVALPMTLGAVRLPRATFVAYNLAGALAFAALYLGLGYLFGEALREILGRVAPYERRIFLGIIATGTLIWVVREYRLFKAAKELADEVEEDEAP
jgi:membrane protein DedA with SNARE-associated domain